MPGYRIAAPVCRYRTPTRLDDGTLCQIASPVPQPVGACSDQVACWDMQQKLLAAARRVTPLLPSEMRGQFAALFSGENLAITAGVLTAWGASHLVGVGEAADVVLVIGGVLTLGWQAFGVGKDIGSFAYVAANAQTYADLDRAARHLARAVVTLGVGTFLALIMKFGSRFAKRGGFSAKAATEGGDALVPAAGESGPWWKASQFGEDFPGTSVPKGFLMETGGQQFRITINACEHMAEYAAKAPSAGQLTNPGVWSTSPGNRLAQVDFPLSSLAGALEQAAKKYGALPRQRFKLEQFGNWELGIDSQSTPWVVEHAVPKGR
jgi:hypothetical protein